MFVIGKRTLAITMCARLVFVCHRLAIFKYIAKRFGDFIRSRIRLLLHQLLRIPCAFSRRYGVIRMLKCMLPVAA